MRIRGAAVTAALVVVIAAGCVGEVGPSSSPAASPTLNPNQREAARRSAAPSVQASPTASAKPSPDASARPTPISKPAGYVPFDPALEALLPASLRGVPLSVYSVNASTFSGGGDMCILLCPDEPARLQSASGVSADRISVAVSVADTKSGIATATIGLRFPGVATGKLVEIRLRAGGHSRPNDGLPPLTKVLRVGGKSVTWATWPPFYEESQGEFLYAFQDILFIVYGGPPNADGTLAADAALMFSVLP